MGITVNPKKSAGGLSSVNTANGVTGTGALATPVKLGGTLTDAFTSITGVNKVFEISDTDGGTITVAFIIAPPSMSIEAFNATDVAQITANGVGGLVGASLYATFTSLAQYLATKNDPNNSNVLGIEVGDFVDNVGLNGRALFPFNNPNQYAQYGNLTSILGIVNTGLRVISGVFTACVIGIKSQLIRVNANLFVDTVGTGCIFTVILIYTDSGGTIRNNTLATISTAVPSIIPPAIVYAKNGTSVSLSVQFGGTADGQYHLFGSAEYVGVQN